MKETDMGQYDRKPDGVRYHASYGRIMVHHGYSLSIFWSEQMLDYLRRHFPTTRNEELAECLCVSQRTMLRKARELGLTKDRQWLLSLWDEHRNVAHAIAKSKGFPGGFKKGHHANPAGEFKPGVTWSEEMKRKQSASMRKWYERHPSEAKAKARKAWETRRRNA